MFRDLTLAWLSRIDDDALYTELCYHHQHNHTRRKNLIIAEMVERIISETAKVDASEKIV